MLGLPVKPHLRVNSDSKNEKKDTSCHSRAPPQVADTISVRGRDPEIYRRICKLSCSSAERERERKHATQVSFNRHEARKAGRKETQRRDPKNNESIITLRWPRSEVPIKMTFSLFCLHNFFFQSGRNTWGYSKSLASVMGTRLNMSLCRLYHYKLPLLVYFRISVWKENSLCAAFSY